LAEVTDDRLLPFQLASSAVRGRLLRLGPELDRLLVRHAYPLPVTRLLGEAVALTALLAGMLKFEGVFSMQASGAGPVRTLVADVTSAGAMRGYAAFDAPRLPDEAAPTLPRLFGRGHLALTVDQGPDTERYQGIVALDGAGLADAALHYFAQSEQLATSVRLACARGADGWRAGALVLQRLPDAVPPPPGEPPVEPEDWRRARMLGDTVTDTELLDPGLASQDLLWRLFHEEGVRIWPTQPLAAGCRCSAERVRVALRSMTRSELVAMTIDGRIEATCQFCSESYRFDTDEVAQLAAAARD
jgi:molecular chaperone Hsp33